MNTSTSLSPNSVRKVKWVNLIFFSVTTLSALIGCPWYLSQYALTAADLALFFFFFAATGMGITAGYHRLFAHTTYKANAFIRFLFLFFGAAAFEQSALMWSSQHRDHHRYVDTDLDPYSIKKGFWYAHMGWLVFWQHKTHYENSLDLQKDPLVVNQHRFYGLWAVTAGIVTPVAIGALFGHALAAFLFAVCLRLTVVYHATFCINSVCHMFGKATYDVKASAKDHWVVALVTFGEGYHNFHHKFPVDYRNGVRWFHWDPSKWLIRSLALLGAAWDLKRTSKFRILEARLAGENLSARHSLLSAEAAAFVSKALDQLALQHERVKMTLIRWEDAVRHYRELVRGQKMTESEDIKIAAIQKTKDARRIFNETYERWNRLIQNRPAELSEVLLRAAA